jgi:hypothetical protein
VAGEWYCILPIVVYYQVAHQRQQHGEY